MRWTWFLPTLAGSPIRNSLTCIDFLYRMPNATENILWGNGQPIGTFRTYGNDTYLCFRGTTSIADWLSDLDTTLVPWDYSVGGGNANRGRVSRGFWGLYNREYDLATNGLPCYGPSLGPWCQTTLGPAKVARRTSIRREVLGAQLPPKFVAGHSLGAALATLAAGDYSVGGGDPVVLAFGSPMVGDPEFAVGYGPRTYLVWHEDDIVPRFPMPCYRHVAGGVRVRLGSFGVPPVGCDIHWAHAMGRYWDAIGTLEKKFLGT